MESETTNSSHEHDYGGSLFGKRNMNQQQFANGSAFGSDHPADIALGRARRLAGHASKAKGKGAEKWAPKGATMMPTVQVPGEP